MENEIGKSCTFAGCVGYAYVPPQALDNVFSPEQALEAATLFPELSLTIDEYGSVCKSEGGCE